MPLTPINRTINVPVNRLPAEVVEELENEDRISNGIATIPVKESPVSKSFRMVRDGERVLMMPSEATGRTITKFELFVAETEAECEAEIARLGLEVPEKTPQERLMELREEERELRRQIRENGRAR